MEIIQYKTNIHCNNCIRAVSGFLNEVEGIESWEVDVEHSDKILTIKGENINPEEVLEAVEDAGFDIEIFVK